VGTIAVTVSDDSGDPIKGLGVSLVVDIAGTVKFVCGIPPTQEDEDDSSIVKTSPMIERRADGVLIVKGVGAGEYRLTVTDGTWKKVQMVTVASAQETIVDLNRN